MANKDEKGASKNARRSSITFEDAARLDYDFVDGDRYTMNPLKIQWCSGNATTGRWRLMDELVHSKFTPIFGDEQIVSANLPAEKGCHHWKAENYPQIETNYGDRFELECEITFAYLEKTERNRSGRSSESLKRKSLTRSYSTKMHVDRNSSINVADTIEEFTNASIRTYFEANSRLLYSVTLDDERCQTYKLTSNRSLNWFYLQEMFARKPELFSAPQLLLPAPDGRLGGLFGVRKEAFLQGSV